MYRAGIGPQRVPFALTNRHLACAFRAEFSGRACFAASPRSSKPGRKLTMHRYRSHTCAQLRKSDVGTTVRLSGWVHRVRDHGGLLFIDLRDHYGLTQIVADPDSPAFKTAETVRGEWVIRVDGEVKARMRRDRQPQPADRRDRDFRARDRGAVGGQGTAAAGVRRAGLSGGHPPEIPLPRPAPRDAAQEHRGAHQDHRRDAQAHGRGRLHRILDADPDRVLAGRRARLPGAVAASIPASSTRCRRRRSSTSS